MDKNEYLDPSRFVYTQMSCETKERPYNMQEIFDAEEGRIYTLYTYPSDSIYPTTLDVDGGTQIVSVRGAAAEKLWAELNLPKKRRFIQLGKVENFPNEEQLFDLRRGILYTYNKEGRLNIKTAAGPARTMVPEFAKLFWDHLKQLAGSEKEEEA
jgi:hypothetical protein